MQGRNGDTALCPHAPDCPHAPEHTNQTAVSGGLSSGGLSPVYFSGLASRIQTGDGDDIVEFDGAFLPFQTFFVSLGTGDDTVIGDSDEQMPSFTRMQINGGTGYDTVLNASYFASPFTLYLFEEIEG